MRLRNAYKFPLQNLQSLFSNIAQIDCDNFAIVFLNLFIFLFLMLFYQTWFFFTWSWKFICDQILVMANIHSSIRKIFISFATMIMLF